MPLSVSAVVDDPLKVVRLTITGGTAPYVVDAAPAGGRAGYRVRSSYGTVAGAPTTRTATDGDAPLNTDVVYVATDATGAQASSATVNVAATSDVLSDATNPSVMLPVRVVSQPPNEWEARSVWWNILGASAPFVSVAPMNLRGGDLVLRTETAADRAALVKLLATGNPFTLRTTVPLAVDDVVGLVERLREDLVVRDEPDGPRHFTLSYQAVSRQLGIYTDDTGRTYAVLTVEAGTYAALLGLYASYDAVKLGDPSAGLGAEQLTNGNFAAGIGAPWSTFWSGGAASWAAVGGVAQATVAAGPANAVIWQAAAAAIPAGPKTLRVTGRVRSTKPATTVKLELLTNNTGVGLAQYFEAGVASVQQVLTADATWRSFAVDLVVTDLTDDLWNVFFRGENMSGGAQVEWDDLSVRWRL